MSNVPKLRFKEFSDKWNEKYLGELSNIKTGKKDTKDKVKNGKFPFFVRSQTIERINTFSFDGEAILTAGDGVGVGKVFHYLNEKFDYHQRVYNIHNFKDFVSGKYIFFYFSNKFYKRVLRLSAKNSVDSVRMEMISKMIIPLPSKKEQEKIASFLTSIDNKIEKLSEKASLLKKYKKGVMQKLLSYKIRFDFDDELRKGKIKDFGSFYYGKGAPKTTISPDGKTPCVRYGELYSTYKEEIREIKSYTTVNPKELKLSKGGEVLVPRVGEDPLDFANCSYLPFKNVAIGEMISVYNTEENGLFISYYMNGVLKKEFAKLVEGGNVSNLYFRYLEEIEIIIPSYEEQTKIANFLSSIDKKIEVTKIELEKTKEFKKALLQQMFI